MNKYLIILFNIIMGFMIIFYTIYRRLLRIRFPKDLFFINDVTINIGLLFFIIMGLFISCYIFVNNLLIILKKKSYKESLLSKILLNLNDIMENALYEVYQFIVNLLFKNPYNKISLFTQKFYKYFKNISETVFLFLLYFIRIIILSCFLTDVFMLFRLQYMYNALYLLCVSLLIKIIFYILKDFSNNLEDAKSFLIIENKGVNQEGLPRTHYTLKHEYKHLDIEYHVGQYILCSKITGYLKIYERFSAFFGPYFNIIIYFLYIMGWLYVLYINLRYFF